MNKKEYILTILDALLGSRPIAKDLKVLVEHDDLNDDAIDILVKVFKQSVSNVHTKIKATKLNEGLEHVQKIQEQAKKSYEEDKISVSRLDNLIRYL